MDLVIKPIEEDVTNGDVLIEIFPKGETTIACKEELGKVEVCLDGKYVQQVDLGWWNALYPRKEDPDPYEDWMDERLYLKTYRD